MKGDKPSQEEDDQQVGEVETEHRDRHNYYGTQARTLRLHGEKGFFTGHEGSFNFTWHNVGATMELTNQNALSCSTNEVKV